jgi:CPA1 family monovalent cation:H+ antiporter
MAIFELVIALLLVGAVLALFSDRIGVPYPALLALAGAALALIPGTPQVMLDPQLALALFVAPVLLDAAYDASPRDLKNNLIAVSSLALIAVGVTIVAVAVIARMLVPGMSWAVAVTLGAIVAPPDASAATTVLRRLRPPHRMVVVLQGESLFNDAGALLVYRVATASAMTGVVAGWSVVPMFVLTCGGGVVVGVLLARLYMWLTTHVDDIPISVLLQFIGTFAVWLLAERIGLSPIITVISYAMTLARSVPARSDARHRISSYAVWDVAVFVLNVLAFVLIGLQLRVILARMRGSDWKTYLLCAAAVCLTVIVVRFVWVMLHSLIVRWKSRRPGSRSVGLPTPSAALVVAWCGMRGIVTLATALALPDGAPSTTFPYRDLIILCAFCVVLTTLVIQGMTLRPLMEWVGLRDDGTVEREVRLARAETARAALRVLEGQGGDSTPPLDSLRREYEARVRFGEAEPARKSSDEPPGAEQRDLQRRAIEAQRRELMDLRARSVIGDDAFHAAEEEIDLLELSGDERIRPRSVPDHES